MGNSLILIPLIPFISSIVSFIGGKMLPRQGGALSIFSVGISFLIAAVVLIRTLAGEIILPWTVTIPWFNFHFYPVNLSLRVDGLALLMLVVLSGVSLIMLVYSLGCMRHDPRVKTYFSLFSLCTAAALCLTMAHDMLLFFVCWEIMSISSLFLVGYWYERPQTVTSARMSTLTLLFGDSALFIALLVIFTRTGTFHIGQLISHYNAGYVSHSVIQIIALMIIVGAVLRAMQLPFHTWGIYATEAPTPVSAFVHSFAMTATGIYALVRFYPLYYFNPFIKNILVIIGAASLITGALLALTATDIKKILTFSTVSEIGFVVFSFGIGAVSPAMFLLITHSFSKLLLLCAAGSIMYGYGTHDIREMGGLAKRMPVTAILFFIGIAGLSGIWPGSGFFSKAAVLSIVSTINSTPMYWISSGAIFLCALYSFRLWFIIFVGDARNVQLFEKAEESPGTLTVPMGIFAFLSVAAGWIIHHFHFISWILSEKLDQAVTARMSWSVIGLSTGGMIAAWALYQKKVFPLKDLMQKLPWVHHLLYNNFWFERIYTVCIGKPLEKAALFIEQIDMQIVENIYANQLGAFVKHAGKVMGRVEAVVIDGCIRACTGALAGIGQTVRNLRSGYIQQYFFVLIIGLAVVIAVMLY